ncbi:Eco57I restriction-modification methylase domain-containing protein [Mesorhizobium sp. AR07]|uniref:Eco57I restriction-modification methylase domain-containing protein n=1 Tax=Mesorhizobium sp. AR07 TaxID=2865838 RepID=UPI00215E9B85|nr:Eco57I restriction-modification methylase domain-containing protein [Mesorhizobium sp. AR07]UVK41821.1 Eco57I restriction-modification methylase domain-containing protein [Mesorhizobium sp. AR07]
MSEYEILRSRIGKEGADRAVTYGWIAPPEGALNGQIPFPLGEEGLRASTSPHVVKAPSSKASQLGQFMTPESISGFMAGLFGKALPSDVRLLDAGAGKGALTTAFINHWMASRSDGVIQTTCYEIDQEFSNILRENISLLSGSGRDISHEVRNVDFIDHASTALRLGRFRKFTHAILNPPYKKINTASHHRACLSAIGLETVNLYAGFVGLGIAMMEEGGELVAIIPRSFCNGPYYQPFRQFIFRHASIRQIHLFDARNKAFKGDGVLQENIIIHLTRGEEQGEVTISTSTDDTFLDYRETIHAFDSIVLARDAEQFIHIPTADGPDLLTGSAFQYRLDELGVSVSTGPVVDFRMKNDLRAEYEPGTVPLLYPSHFTHHGFAWPKPGFKKANAIRETRETAKWLFPCGFYTVVRRFSSKEERRRIIANVVEPTALPTKMIGFENHLNVFHDRKQPLSEDMARGMATYLNSTVVDQCFRRFNGHTQVNATDLKTMRYPSRDALALLGKWAKSHPQPSQETIDARVAELA